MATKAEKGRVSIMTKQQKKTLNLVLTYLVIILIGCGCFVLSSTIRVIRT